RCLRGGRERDAAVLRGCGGWRGCEPGQEQRCTERRLERAAPGQSRRTSRESGEERCRAGPGRSEGRCAVPLGQHCEGRRQALMRADELSVSRSTEQ
ncbi:hypothetical protein COCON_G00235580, partial [Conger conger]